VLYAHGGFGATHIDTLTITPNTNPVLDVYINGSLNAQTNYTLLTCGAINGDASTITLSNYSSLTEIKNVNLSSGAPGSGITALGNTVTVTAAPTATYQESTAQGTLTDFAAGVMGNISNLSKAMSMEYRARAAAPRRASPLKIARRVGLMPGQRVDTTEQTFLTLAQDNTTPVVSDGDTYRVWMSPYHTHTHNRGTGYKSGFTERFYGLMAGVSQNLSRDRGTVGLFMGAGLSRMQMQRHEQNRSKGKQVMLGGTYSQKFWGEGLVSTLLNAVVTDSNTQRLGQPTPTASYLATSRSRAYGLSSVTDVSYLFRLQNNYSLRHNVGLDFGLTRRAGFKERAPDAYAQKYKSKFNKQGELYTGIGGRKKWKTEDVEAKFTLLYEIGAKSGNDRASDKVYVRDAPSGVSLSSPSTGRMTHYINGYGSLLHFDSGVKLIAGVTASLSKRQESYLYTLKAEYRF
jgi:hypothetical protein